ncbi:Uncharacterized protein dnm_002660 [Desulfonema magnum]|uniref:Uncharacterized protein n=1 Tax=Desulfonema magnum TaxID=45655 RepID=A0A975BF54_9BACT|nr:Uncharacterized protein dnm_002660 [Desulfonema magnum]
MIKNLIRRFTKSGERYKNIDSYYFHSYSLIVINRHYRK